MKVTAILPDELVREVQHLSNGKNITESLKIVLREWSALEKIKKLNRKVSRKPLKFRHSAVNIRETGRKS